MKKIVSPLANGGAPFYSGDINGTIQDEIYKVLIASFQAWGYFPGITNGKILSGMYYTSINTMTQTANISEGYVLLNGDIIYFPAYSGSYMTKVYQNPASTFTTRVFNDASVHNFDETKTVIVTAGATTGEYINLDVNIVESARINHDIWNQLNAKANISQGAWTAIVPTAPWTATAGYTCSYRRGTTGLISLRGTMNIAVAVNASPMLTLPLGYRPIQTVSFKVCEPFGVNLGQQYSILFGSGGIVTFYTDTLGGSIDVALDGIHFYAD